MGAELADTSLVLHRTTAFVDASVIAAYLTGEPDATQLFNNGYRDRVRYAVDPVVLQEVLTLPEVQQSPGLLSLLRDRVEFDILPLDVDRSQLLLDRARALRNRFVHSSDLLIAASAADCDFLITYGRTLRELIKGDRPRVVTPDEFRSLLASR